MNEWMAAKGCMEALTEGRFVKEITCIVCLALYIIGITVLVVSWFGSEAFPIYNRYYSTGS